MREFLVETLEKEGSDPSVDEAGNTLATRVGDASGPHIVLNTHIDTVPPHLPFERSDGDVACNDGPGIMPREVVR